MDERWAPVKVTKFYGEYVELNGKPLVHGEHVDVYIPDDNELILDCEVVLRTFTGPAGHGEPGVVSTIAFVKVTFAFTEFQINLDNPAIYLRRRNV